MEYAALARNGVCNVPTQCSAGDWDDCGAPQAASEGAGKLLNVLSASVDVLIRNCTALNLTLQSQATLGVVDSVFDPPLDTASMRTVSPPSCGTRVAGEELCDPRANCTLAASGGVHCACVGGLRYKPGAPEDGTECLADTQLSMQVFSQTLSAKIRKPSDRSQRVSIQVQASGEKPFEAPYVLSMRWILARDADSLSPRVHASASWDSPVDLVYSLHGFHVKWNRALGNASLDLDRATWKFSAAQDIALQLDAVCSSQQQPCVSDGDMIVMDLSLASPAGSLALATVVTIIDSYVSCDNSKVTVIPNEVTLPRSSHLVVRFLANDADNMPVNYTQGEIEFRWAGQLFPSTWARGRNEYIADVPRQWTDIGGQYELTVGIRHSWNLLLN
jgi:hypothetical protein